MERKIQKSGSFHIAPPHYGRVANMYYILLVANALPYVEVRVRLFQTYLTLTVTILEDVKYYVFRLVLVFQDTSVSLSLSSDIYHIGHKQSAVIMYFLDTNALQFEEEKLDPEMR